MANKEISIPFSEEDLQELQSGETFDWTFPVKDSKTDEWIDVHLYQGEEDEPLVCVEENCDELQTGEGEYCEKHYPN